MKLKYGLVLLFCDNFCFFKDYKKYLVIILELKGVRGEGLLKEFLYYDVEEERRCGLWGERVVVVSGVRRDGGVGWWCVDWERKDGGGGV